MSRISPPSSSIISPRLRAHLERFATGELDARPFVARLLEIANPKHCAHCGRRFWGARSDAAYCSDACQSRAKRRRRDPHIGSLERRWNQIHASDMKRLETLDPTWRARLPGHPSAGGWRDEGDHRPDDRGPTVKARASRDGKMAARSRPSTGWSDSPPGLTFDPFWRAVQYGARLLEKGERPPKRPPLGSYVLDGQSRHRFEPLHAAGYELGPRIGGRRRVYRRVAIEGSELKSRGIQTRPDSPQEGVMTQDQHAAVIDRLVRIERKLDEALVRQGDPAAIEREVDKFIESASQPKFAG